MDQDERHRIFKEELYPWAHLPKLDFQIKVGYFLDKYPEIAKEEKVDPHISRSELKKFVKDQGRSYDY